MFSQRSHPTPVRGCLIQIPLHCIHSDNDSIAASRIYRDIDLTGRAVTRVNLSADNPRCIKYIADPRWGGEGNVRYYYGDGAGIAYMEDQGTCTYPLGTNQIQDYLVLNLSHGYFNGTALAA